MKLVVALLALVVALPVPARERVSPNGMVKAGDDESEAAPAPAAPAWRATQVNRCTDASGRVKLQDTPCAPVAATAAEATAASAGAGVVELSSLAPRPPVEPARASLREPQSNGLGAALLALSWKLGLFVLVGYAIFRLIRAWRDAYRFAPPSDDAPSSGLRRGR